MTTPKQQPPSKTARPSCGWWLLHVLAIVCVAAVTWELPLYYRVWKDEGCLDPAWPPRTTCQLHVGVPQTISTSAIQQFAIEYAEVLHASERYLTNFYAANNNNKDNPAAAICRNRHMDCTYQATLGRCDDIPDMKTICALACQACPEVVDEEQAALCAIDPSACREQQSSSVPQYSPQAASRLLEQAFATHVQAGATYLTELAAAENLNKRIREALPYCMNRYPDCTRWALEGMCNGEERFHSGVQTDMRTDCPVSCNCCEQLLYDFRCPLDPEVPNAWEPGTLHQLFWDLSYGKTKDAYEGNLHVWSAPTIGASGHLVADTAPWLVSIENFLTEHEADTLIALGEGMGYERSDDWAEYMPDGTVQTYFHDGRTSYQAWCEDGCDENSTVEGITNKIAALTGIPPENSEKLQLLRYNEGQKYDLHHDYDDTDQFRQQGVRILTVFLYLSDVTDGGGTHFPQLNNVTFTPRKGRLVMWPNVLNADPHTIDDRTEHAALPAGPGTIKYAANSWIHQRSVTRAVESNCDA